MRRYTISINGADHEVDVEEVTANTFRVQIAGHGVDVRLRDHQDVAQAMITPNLQVAGRQPGPVEAPERVVTERVTTGSTGGAGSDPAPTGRPAARPASTPAPTAAAPGGAGTLTAPMPGVVLSVNVAPGDSVSRGDVLLVLEAMKMKNELRAPKDAVVASVPAEVGSQVGFGQALVVFS